MDEILLWALPDTWTQFELLASDAQERIEDEMRRRFEDTGVEESDLAPVIALQLEAIRDYAANGVVLLATHAETPAQVGDPPPGLSLTLALANRPESGLLGQDSATAGAAAPAEGRSARTTAFLSEANALVLEDSELAAFTCETRTEISVPGFETPLDQFQAQAFVLPKGHAGMAVITVTTFDPHREEDARRTARTFANTLVFVTDDEKGPVTRELP